ncbi:hypothetical protein [Pseudomonas sp. BP8]|uniref:hypothetical protein n=1 Tax=Pseudomonas sp. BP8 TaxID=2817864 RepID=UPI001AEB1351|nr:hypothetical protein [Pseudomonas sp. BP8]MBP2263578.1 hypothetical protein [Pseudomonas sp. BP8]HDS1735569.1 hypothetical protein [Pseudomonas putida]
MNKYAGHQITAQHARQAVRSARAQAVGTDAQLAPPGIPAALIADATDNTVLAAYLKDDDKDLSITIPKWDLVAPSRDPDKFILSVDDGKDELYSGEYTSDDESLFPLELKLDRARVRAWGDGPRTFKYTVERYNGALDESTELVLRLDTRPPYQDKPPTVFPVIPNVLDGNKGTVTVSLPDYTDRAPKDHVWVFWVKGVPEDPWSVEPVAKVEVTAADQSITIPVDKIEAIGNGGVNAFYVLLDKAGNVSHMSDYRQVGVALGAWPTVYEDPSVPLANDLLIDQEDVALGVEVHVKAFDNSDPLDEVQVTWGAYSSPWTPVGPPKFPMIFPIAGLDIWAAYGKETGAGSVDAHVTYSVRRGSVTMGTKAIDVAVNLERIGPVDPGPDPDPDWPDPINSKMLPALIQGKVSATDNVLTEADENQPAELSVDIDAAFQENDIVSFYWAGNHVAEADITLGAGQPGTTLTAEIPWSYIMGSGNGTVAVHYRVTRTDNPNPPQSPITNVAVDAIVLRPDAPAFDIPSGRYLNCSALWTPGGDHADDPAFRVQVPDLSVHGVKAGDTVTLKWRATTFDKETAIPAVDLEETIEVDATTVKGFIWRVQPYADHILPIDQADPADRDGYGYAHYEFELGGKTVRSLDAKAPVSINGPAGTCDLTRP